MKWKVIASTNRLKSYLSILHNPLDAQIPADESVARRTALEFDQMYSYLNSDTMLLISLNGV